MMYINFDHRYLSDINFEYWYKEQKVAIFYISKKVQMETENSSLREKHIIVPLDINDCFGLQNLKANKFRTNCYCRFL